MKSEIDAFPKITFLLYSSTVKFKNYNLTNVPTSTGRADMLIRVIRSIVYAKNTYESKMGLVFFPNTSFLKEISELKGIHDFKAFLVSSQSNYFRNKPFTISSEHELLSRFYDSFLYLGQDYSNSLFYRSYSMDVYECVDELVQNGIKVYILHEDGKKIENFDERIERMSFMLGDQLGYNEVDLTRFSSKVERISLGSTSYLGSSIITLIKWMLWRAGFI